MAMFDSWFDYLTGWRDSIKSWFGLLVGYLASAAAVIFWEIIGKHLLCWLEQWWCWVLDLGFRYSLKYMRYTLAHIPSVPDMPLGPLVHAWLIANHYFPVNETILFVGIAFFPVAYMRGFRFVKQFVPAASN